MPRGLTKLNTLPLSMIENSFRSSSGKEEIASRLCIPPLSKSNDISLAKLSLNATLNRVLRVVSSSVAFEGFEWVGANTRCYVLISPEVWILIAMDLAMISSRNLLPVNSCRAACWKRQLIYKSFYESGPLYLSLQKKPPVFAQFFIEGVLSLLRIAEHVAQIGYQSQILVTLRPANLFHASIQMWKNCVRITLTITGVTA